MGLATAEISINEYPELELDNGQELSLNNYPDLEKNNLDKLQPIDDDLYPEPEPNPEPQPYYRSGGGGGSYKKIPTYNYGVEWSKCAVEFQPKFYNIAVSGSIWSWLEAWESQDNWVCMPEYWAITELINDFWRF
jgi:hypothetical protein